MEAHRETVLAALRSVLGRNQRIVWRRSESRLQQDGWTQTGHNAQDEEGEEKKVWVKELGLRYKVDLEAGQKTGAYPDQRETRAVIRGLARGKRVLDLFCYTGGECPRSVTLLTTPIHSCLSCRYRPFSATAGFALNAGIGGCVEAVGVDSSGGAIELATENARANGLDSTVRFLKADALKFLEEAHARGEQFDLVILDPPKLAPSRQHLRGALRKYTALNAAALSVLNPKGGLLLTCSCSSAVTTTKDQLLEVVKGAASQRGKQISLLRTGGAALDHVISPHCLESSYLTSLLLAVH